MSKVKIVLKQIDHVTGQHMEIVREVNKWDRASGDAFRFTFTGDYNFDDRVLVVPCENVLYVEDLIEDETKD